MIEVINRNAFYQDEKEEWLTIKFSTDEDEPIEGGEGEGEGESEEGEVGPTITLTSDDIVGDSFEMFDGITNHECLNFQNSISTYIKFTTTHTEYALMGRWLEVRKYIWDAVNEDTIEVDLGKYYCATDNMSRDGLTQEIVAYDKMFHVLNTDPEVITALYHEIYQNVSPVNVKNFRDYFFRELGVEQDNTALINDDIVLPKQLSDDDLIDGGTIVKMIAEINGVFPHIKNDGLLHWISLDVGDIFESTTFPSSTLYPSDKTFPCKGYEGFYVDIYKDQYVKDSLVWANYSALPPDGVQIRNELNQIAYFANSENSINPYTVINNFLCFGLQYGQYQQIAERLYQKIKDISYIPYEIVKMSDPCIEVGDRLLIRTQNDHMFSSYLFTRHTAGIRGAFEESKALGQLLLSQYDLGGATNNTDRKLKNLDNRVGNIEKSGSGPLQIQSVAELPASPQLNVLYLIQGEVVVS